jgi:hypothetical protein
MYYHVRVRGTGGAIYTHPSPSYWKETPQGIHFSDGENVTFYPWANVVWVKITNNKLPPKE